MKYIKKYNTEAQYVSDATVERMKSGEFSLPNVGYIEENKGVHYNKKREFLDLKLSYAGEGITEGSIIEVNTGESVTVNVSVTPSTASDKSIIWTVGDETIATVTGSGTTFTINGIAQGQTTITCRTNLDPTATITFNLKTLVSYGEFSLDNKTWYKIGANTNVDYSIKNECPGAVIILYGHGNILDGGYVKIISKQGKCTENAVLNTNKYFANNQTVLVDSFNYAPSGNLKFDFYSSENIKICTINLNIIGNDTSVTYACLYDSQYQSNKVIRIYDNGNYSNYELPSQTLTVGDTFFIFIGGDSLPNIGKMKIDFSYNGSTMGGSSKAVLYPSDLKVESGQHFAGLTVNTLKIETKKQIEGTGNGEVDIEIYDTQGYCILACYTDLNVTA